MSDRTRGLFRKFIVTRTDGTSEAGQKHDGCEYFVLDMTHDPYAKAAASAYVDACKADYPLLAADMVRDFKLRADALAPPEPCVWTLEDEDGSAYQTSCGNMFEFNDGGPSENKAKFCQYCGKALVVSAPPRADALEAPRTEKVTRYTLTAAVLAATGSGLKDNPHEYQRLPEGTVIMIASEVEAAALDAAPSKTVRGMLTVQDLQLAASIVADSATEAGASTDPDLLAEAPILSKLSRDLDIAAFELGRAADCGAVSRPQHEKVEHDD